MPPVWFYDLMYRWHAAWDAFYAARSDLPRISLMGPSRLVPVLGPGEEVELFGNAFEIERLPEPRPEHLTATFVMTRRDTRPPGQAN